MSPSDQDATLYREGDQVTVDLFGRTTDAVIEHVYDDGGVRIKAGPALWLHLPADSIMGYVVTP